ncbi:putative transposable element [Trichonephila clavipes]|nr:putative transposable element [Trichonephila clavipes]
MGHWSGEVIYIGRDIPKIFFYKQVKKSSTQVITAQGAKCRNIGVVELNIRIRDFKKPWLFHVLANLEYPCILGIDFIGGSKIILDFDRKSLAIQESQVEDIKVDDGNLCVDLSETKLNVVANVSDNNTIESIIGEKVNCAIIRDLVLSSRDQLIEEQKTDPELGHIYRYLENPEHSSVNAAICENWSCDFRLVEGLLFYAKYATSLGEMRVYIPPKIYNLVALHFKYDKASRRFVEWAQNEIAVVPDFHKRILFSDEAHFWLNGCVNKQNCRIWSEANPQVYVETPLHPEKLTVWCALWAGGIIGPYFFKSDEGHNVTVNGDRYRAMITNFFIPELNNHDVQELWFQQDGETYHTARATIDLLKDTFGDRIISRFGPVNWPPRSCDLTPLDYFLWGYVKSLVYADKPQTLDHLEDNIRRVIADIRPQMLEKVIENWTSRLDYIRGSPMPEIIFKIMLVGDTNVTDIEIVLKFKQFVSTFPIHGIRDDSIGQRETIVPNTQQGQTLAVEKDLGIFLGSGH